MPTGGVGISGPAVQMGEIEAPGAQALAQGHRQPELGSPAPEHGAPASSIPTNAASM